VTDVVVDTHTLHWAAAEPSKLSTVAAELLGGADAVLVPAVVWYELAWHLGNGTIIAPGPTSELDYLTRLSDSVVTAPLDAAIAWRAASLSAHPAFPKDPFDRLIYATAVQRGAPLVTRDTRLLGFDSATCRW
jgi:PIN domain nuclease of toxin-antitoxin system